MYISLFDINQNHITNVSNVSYNLTRRAFDADTFTVSGFTEDNVLNSKIMVLNDENDNDVYSCLVDNLTIDSNNIVTLKGLDFKRLLESDALITFPGVKLYEIINTSVESIINNDDTAFQKIPFKYNYTTFDDDTILFGDFTDIQKVVNARKFISPYLKYYNIREVYKYYESTREIELTFIRGGGAINITLDDFDVTKTTTSSTINKCVAGLEIRTDGEGIINHLPKQYYFLTASNNIVESSINQLLDDRLYPVVEKHFYKEFLADAQFEAIKTLAENRFVDNIILNETSQIYPIDFTKLDLLQNINIYISGFFYKTLPISEITQNYTKDSFRYFVKLGFKRILLTEIIKGD
jgi:hypothetical protein